MQGGNPRGSITLISHIYDPTNPVLSIFKIVVLFSICSNSTPKKLSSFGPPAPPYSSPDESNPYSLLSRLDFFLAESSVFNPPINSYFIYFSISSCFLFEHRPYIAIIPYGKVFQAPFRHTSFSLTKFKLAIRFKSIS